MRRTLFLLLVAACSGGTTTRPDPSTPATARVERPDVSDPQPTAESEIEPDCEGSIPIYANGRDTGRTVCAESERFTVVSLDDEWTPVLFEEDPSLGERGHQPYRDTYLALANERFDQMDDPNSERLYLELFGIFPTPTVLNARIADDARHECHDQVDDTYLERLEETIRFNWTPEMRGRFARRHERREAHLARILEESELEHHSELEDHPEHAGFYERYRRSLAAVGAIEAAQQHLACDGLIELDDVERGALDAPTMRAMRKFQRKQMIVGRGHLDRETASALALDSREQDFRATLRMLRERVVAATGLIEDGSARHEWGRVLGRRLDPPDMRFRGRQPAAPNGAPDRISAATEAAARALGLSSPAGARERLANLPDQVAVQLPAVPEYRSENGDRVLWVEIHRGDPSRRNDAGSSRAVRPMTTLYTMDGDTPVALVRWPTTIGGYKDFETDAGYVGTKMHESPLGRRVWRHIVASPAWLPPPSTPDQDLILGRGSNWRPNDDLLGPGYESAYGLAMMVHEKPRPVEDAEEGEEAVRYFDEGIRSHGSVSYHSITNGSSHGCHRLYNHLAVRMASYLVDHRQHTRHGNEAVQFARTIRHAGKAETVNVSSRGYFYELTNPVPVLVLDGRAAESEAEVSIDAALHPNH